MRKTIKKINKQLTKYFIIIFGIITIFLIPYIIFASDSGGVTGAEFLEFSSSTRFNSMGMVIDGLGNYHEGLFLNQALLAQIEKAQINVSLTPMPNDVSYSQLNFDIPLYRGVGGVGIQLLNIGQFTYVNSSLQSEKSMYIFDSALTLGYGQYVFKSIAAGGAAKFIYRSLGDYNAFALGFDAGGAYWFETPHIGQRPKPISEKVLSKKEEGEKKMIEKKAKELIDKEKHKIEEIQSEIKSLKKQKIELDRKISETKEEEKKKDYEEKLKNIDLKIKDLNLILEKQKKEYQKKFQEIKGWKNGEIGKISAKYSSIRNDFKKVTARRKKLFEVVDDPEKELDDKIIEDTINDVITKTKNYLKEMLGILAEEKINYAERRNKHINEILKDIESYKKQLDEEFKPEIQKKEREIAALEKKLSELPEKKNEEQKALASELQALVKKKRNELVSIKNDPWYKRLNKRIAEKQIEIEKIKKDIKEQSEKIQEEAERIQKEIGSEIKYFENLEEWLKKELKKAKLKRELDLLKASSERRRKKALKEYEEKEKNIYLKLLSTKFSHEKKIINSKIEALRSSYNDRVYDIESETDSEISRLEDEYIFQVKYEKDKLKELEKKKKGLSVKIGSNKGVEPSQKNQGEIRKIDFKIQDIKKKLKTLEADYKNKVEQLMSTKKEMLKKEELNFNRNLSELKWEMYLTRLLYLQTDTPYKNTTVNLALQNFGSKVRFVSEGYPLPTSFHASLGYGFIHTDEHLAILSFQFDFPFHEESSFGLGIEYAFLYTFFARAGVRLTSDGSRFSFGTGVITEIGFTRYSIEYTFMPITNYGSIHNFGVSLGF